MATLFMVVKFGGKTARNKMDDFLKQWEEIDFHDQSVEGRNKRQNCNLLHPYTCGNNRTDEAHKAYQKEHGGDFGQLGAVENGWLCPVCGYTQPLNR